ncbi:precorrin-3B synthase [Epibacterium ulvae]|uniref:precorrin-3B synthase n=1 Tax=Epibacterium ulvae TaxID=1156985 RepID=UPI001BFC11B7|nr:precorrin-3B synthase [Epibacterium ulvae]MBT8154344.1 precorrin-3B synthase [Epibacterium ulvae]
MSATPQTPPNPKVYGWCPGALRPMQSGDGLVVRIRTPLGRLSQEQATRVAELSQEFGNGLLDLSARANLQLRGVSRDNHAALIAALQEIGLVDDTAKSEALRNIVVTPFWQTDDLNTQLARALAHQLAQTVDLALPGKFGFAIDTAQAPVLQSTAADIRIEVGTDGHLLLCADGSDLGKPVTEATAAQEAITLARWFLDQGGAPDGRGRMQRLLARRAIPSVFTAPRRACAQQPTPGTVETCPKGHLVALEFGQIAADQLRELADLGAIRLTPWRMLLLEGNAAIPDLPGLILDATDPRLQVVACTGAPGCLQAHAQTRALARQLAPRIPQGKTLHISGCAKGCAHPKPADLTLTARSPTTFDLIRNATAADHPDLSELDVDDLPNLLTSEF